MKKIIMFTMASCPYCRIAHRWIDSLLKKNPEYNAVDFQIIDEVQKPHVANNYDYWYVPTFYIEDEKVHEGAVTPKIIKSIFERALNDY